MLLLCQRTPALRRATVTVLEVREVDGRWHARTDDTVLYPEGGGQPADHGTLGGREVVALRRADDGVVHVLTEPVAPGSLEVEVDWRRRYDHMQQHTAQHLLTAVVQDTLGLATTSFHLHAGLEATCDVELDGDLTASALPDLEARVNTEIRAARAVTASACDPGDLEVRRVRTRGLPDGHTGPVRLVEIAGIDVNTCGGTHVASTAELQALALLGVERLRGGSRLTFVAGGRVLTRLRAATAVLREAGAALSRPPAEVAAGVERLLSEQKALVKGRDELQDELLELHAAPLAGEGGGYLHRASGDLAWANRLAGALSRADPGARLLVTLGPDEDATFLLAGPREWVDAAKGSLLAALGVKGGGPPGRVQGKGATAAAARAWWAARAR